MTSSDPYGRGTGGPFTADPLGGRAADPVTGGPIPADRYPGETYGDTTVGSTSGATAADDISVTRRPVPPGGHDRIDETDVGEVSLGTLVGNLTGDLSRLMRAELALAKAEAKEEAQQAGKGAGMLAGAGVGGHFVLLFASLALMFALDEVMPMGWAALIVAVLWAVVAAVLYSTGRKNLRRATPPMQETVDTLKEDAQWAKRPRG